MILNLYIKDTPKLGTIVKAILIIEDTIITIISKSLLIRELSY